MAQQKLKPKEFFEQLNAGTMHLVDAFYDSEARFADPLGEHKGSKAIKAYYENLYQNVRSIHFEFTDEVVQGEAYAGAWTMTLECALNGGKPFSLEGISLIKFGGAQGKAVYHQDYFDMGAFVYEGLPVLGGIIRMIKGKMSGLSKEKNNA